jgi:hypothetical protein
VLLQGFYRGIWSEGVVHIPTGIGDVSAGFGDARAAGTIRGRRNPGGVAVSSPRAWARSRRSGRALRLVFNAGRRVRFPQPPSIGSRIADSSLSC